MRILVIAVLLAACLCAAPRSDADVESDIRARFAKSKIAVNGFEVRVRSGTAVLTGRTGIIQHKGVATRLAKLGGAARVDNRIQISEAAREKAAADLAQAREDARREQRSQPRTTPRSEPRAAPVPQTKEPSAASETAPASPAPPPVRRAVVKR